jgi:hypothetical protein
MSSLLVEAVLPKTFATVAVPWYTIPPMAKLTPPPMPWPELPPLSAASPVAELLVTVLPVTVRVDWPSL